MWAVRIRPGEAVKRWFPRRAVEDARPYGENAGLCTVGADALIGPR